MKSSWLTCEMPLVLSVPVHVPKLAHLARVRVRGQGEGEGEGEGEGAEAHRFSARRYTSLPAELPPGTSPSSEPV